MSSEIISQTNNFHKDFKKGLKSVIAHKQQGT